MHCTGGLVKDYRTRMRLREVNNKNGRGEKGKCPQTHTSCPTGADRFACVSADVVEKKETKRFGES